MMAHPGHERDPGEAKRARSRSLALPTNKPGASSTIVTMLLGCGIGIKANIQPFTGVQRRGAGALLATTLFP